MQTALTMENQSLPTVRPATPGDAEALSALAKQAFTEAFGYLFTPQKLDAYLTEEYDISEFDRVLTDPRYRLLVLEADGKAIGYTALKRDSHHALLDAPRQWQLLKLYLLQTYVGRGLGPLLLDHAVAECRPYAPLTLWLEVADVNPRGRAFYERNGYSSAGGEEKLFAGDGFHIEIMRRDIA